MYPSEESVWEQKGLPRAGKGKSSQSGGGGGQGVLSFCVSAGSCSKCYLYINITTVRLAGNAFSSVE